MELSNEDLFLLAWQVPITKIAAAVGVSDVAFKKTCRNRGIPTPPRGYWAKVQAGYGVPRPPSPVWSRSADSLKLQPRSETELLEMLQLARASTTSDSSASEHLGNLRAQSSASLPHDEAVSVETPSTASMRRSMNCRRRLRLSTSRLFASMIFGSGRLSELRSVVRPSHQQSACKSKCGSLNLGSKLIAPIQRVLCCPNCSNCRIEAGN